MARGSESQADIPVMADGAVAGGMPPPVPADEVERLADLRELGVLQQGRDPELDDIVELAALITGAPISVVSIVEEDEQVFAASAGLDAERTSRDVSFCGHAVAAGSRPLIVPDASADPRFADNPLVTGDPHIASYAGVPLVSDHGHAIGTLCVISDEPATLTDRQVRGLERLAARAMRIIEERGRLFAQRQAEVGAQTVVDTRTGLPMRGAMIAALARRGPLRVPVSSLALRVEEAGAKGSTGGLLAGGALLGVATTIRGCLPDDAQLGRAFGSFLAVLPGIGATDAHDIALRIKEALREGVPDEAGGQVAVAVTSGVATLDALLAVSIDDLVMLAEDALRRTPTFGITCETIAGGDVLGRARRMEITRDLFTAVLQHQLDVMYQPIVLLPHGEVVGAEALVRWNHPTLGQILPGEFIPIAEEQGAIAKLDNFVLERALSDFASGVTPGSEVSVNISPAAIDLALADRVTAALAAAGVAPAALVLEVTEHGIGTGAPEIAESLRRVSALGVRIALDDFGAGTTSLAHLRHLPIDRLKCDRMFAADLLDDESAQAARMLGGICDLASGLGIEVLVEGIELSVQHEHATRAGVALAQGYLFGMPQAAQLQ